MNTLISQPMGSVIDRFEHPTAGVGTGASRVVRPSGLTSLDIETEAGFEEVVAMDRQEDERFAQTLAQRGGVPP